MQWQSNVSIVNLEVHSRSRGAPVQFSADEPATSADEPRSHASHLRIRGTGVLGCVPRLEGVRSSHLCPV